MARRNRLRRFAAALLAAAVLLPPAALVRARFRQVYGKSLRDVILDLRIRTAASMLLRTKASVHAIARKTGFASDAHFVRLFRKKTGSTPSAYRAGAHPKV